ncbi:unnamed protein product [Thelazia callipaeda]|uniref:ASD2 domain-containing protein n=1 Tax=Thelazia callipaeda TaxID=103827 RepID=A0A0N5DAN1_THECL|nr:unnamed protein product [Thelazia callipaeda]
MDLNLLRSDTSPRVAFQELMRNGGLIDDVILNGSNGQPVGDTNGFLNNAYMETELPSSNRENESARKNTQKKIIISDQVDDPISGTDESSSTFTDEESLREDGFYKDLLEKVNQSISLDNKNEYASDDESMKSTPSSEVNKSSYDEKQKTLSIDEKYSSSTENKQNRPLLGPDDGHNRILCSNNESSQDIKESSDQRDKTVVEGKQYQPLSSEKMRNSEAVDDYKLEDDGIENDSSDISEKNLSVTGIRDESLSNDSQNETSFCGTEKDSSAVSKEGLLSTTMHDESLLSEKQNKSYNISNEDNEFSSSVDTEIETISTNQQEQSSLNDKKIEREQKALIDDQKDETESSDFEEEEEGEAEEEAEEEADTDAQNEYSSSDIESKILSNDESSLDSLLIRGSNQKEHVFESCENCGPVQSQFTSLLDQLLKIRRKTDQLNMIVQSKQGENSELSITAQNLLLDTLKKMSKQEEAINKIQEMKIKQVQHLQRVKNLRMVQLEIEMKKLYKKNIELCYQLEEVLYALNNKRQEQINSQDFTIRMEEKLTDSMQKISKDRKRLDGKMKYLLSFVEAAVNTILSKEEPCLKFFLEQPLNGGNGEKIHQIKQLMDENDRRAMHETEKLLTKQAYSYEERISGIVDDFERYLIVFESLQEKLEYVVELVDKISGEMQTVLEKCSKNLNNPISTQQ